MVGNGLVVGERSGGEDRIHFARYLYHGESRQDLAREYFDVYYPQDAGMRRLMGRPEGRLVHIPDLYTEEERKTSPVYNEGWRHVIAQNGLTVHFDDPDGLRLVWGTGDPVGSRGWQSAPLSADGAPAAACPPVRPRAAGVDGGRSPGCRAGGPAGQRPHRRGGAGPWRAGAGGQRPGARDPAQRRRAARPRRRPGRLIAGGPQPLAPAAEACAAGLVGGSPERRFDDGPAPLGAFAAGAAREPGGRRGGGFRWAAGWRCWCWWWTRRTARASTRRGW